MEKCTVQTEQEIGRYVCKALVGGQTQARYPMSSSHFWSYWSRSPYVECGPSCWRSRLVVACFSTSEWHFYHQARGWKINEGKQNIKKTRKKSRIETCMCSAQTSKSKCHIYGNSGCYVLEIFVITSHIQKQLPLSWQLG